MYMVSEKLYDLSVEWDAWDGDGGELLESIPTELLDEGEILYEQGGTPVEFSLIKTGKMEVAKYSPNADKTIIGIFGSGEPVGALAVINNFKYPARVTALQDTIVYRISGDLVERIQQTFPGWFSECIGQTAVRMNDLADRFQSMTTKNVAGRLSQQLLQFAEKYGEQTEEGIKINTKLTRQMLADLVGCRVESAIRQLSQWEQKGIIRTDQSVITITNPPQFRTLAGS